MLKTAMTSALALTIMISTCGAAHADVDAAQISKRKNVIHHCLLKIYVDQKKRPQAIAEYQAIVALDPNDAKIRTQFGQYLAQGGTPADYNAAIVQLQKAVQLDPGNGQFNGILGTLYLKVKRFDDSIKYLKLAVQYGASDYKKVYEETWKYVQQVKQREVQMKRLEEQKKLQKQQQQQTGTNGGKTGGGGGDDDDDDW